MDTVDKGVLALYLEHIMHEAILVSVKLVVALNVSFCCLSFSSMWSSHCLKDIHPAYLYLPFSASILPSLSLSLCACVCVRVYVCVCVSVRVCVCVSLHACVHANVSVYESVCMYMHKCVSCPYSRTLA